MDDRRRSADGRERLRGRGAFRSRGTGPRPHRHPVYGGQARRDTRYRPYIISFIVIVAVLAGFLYVGLNWATGPGRVAALANPPTATPIPVVPPAAPTPTPTAPEQTYVVKAGDNPASIAQQFKIKTEELMAANNIDDPSKLQIGQTLKIPAPTGAR